MRGRAHAPGARSRASRIRRPGSGDPSQARRGAPAGCL